MVFKKINSFYYILLAALFFTACDPKRIFEQNKTIEKNNWDYNIPLSFTVDIKDTSNYHDMYINIRNAGFYRFRNVFVFINTRLPQGQMLRDTVELTLASPEGKWNGEGLGDIYDNRLLFRNHFKFPQTGEYRFELIHAMRINPLPGIMDAGIRIEKE